jgi:serine/threonine-protein phosphatase PGAM5
MARTLLVGLLAAAAMAGEPAPEPKAHHRTVVLLRHGQYDEKDPKADPVAGAGLTPLGVAQARLTGARLSAERFDAVLASPRTRARQTAQVVAEDLHARIEVIDELAECTPPTWRTEAVADEKAEEMTACARTLDRVFADRFRPSNGASRRELVVCHGNVIRYLVTKALKVDTKAWLEMSVGHASLTTIRVEADGTLKVIAVGDVGHLPPTMQTGSTGHAHRSLQVPAP